MDKKARSVLGKKYDRAHDEGYESHMATVRGAPAQECPYGDLTVFARYWHEGVSDAKLALFKRRSRHQKRG